MTVLRQWSQALQQWTTVGGSNVQQSPATCFVHRNSVDQSSVATATTTKVLFTTKQYDVGGGYDLSANRFRPAIPGYYLVSFSVGLASAVGSSVVIRANVYLNGANYYAVTVISSSSTGYWNNASGTCLVYLNGTTDYLELYGLQNSGSTQSFGGTSSVTFLQAALIPLAGAPNQVLDLSSAATDYPMQVGDVARVSFSGATSVPLHVQCANGQLYELKLVGDKTVTPNSGNTVLCPNNNQSLPAGCVDNLLLYTTATKNAASGALSPLAYKSEGAAFLINYFLNIVANATVSTSTVNKTVMTESIGVAADATTYQYQTIAGTWDDTTTAWTSLGTIVLPYAQTGFVSIRRTA